MQVPGKRVGSGRLLAREPEGPGDGRQGFRRGEDPRRQQGGEEVGLSHDLGFLIGSPIGNLSRNQHCFARYVAFKSYFSHQSWHLFRPLK